MKNIILLIVIAILSIVSCSTDDLSSSGPHTDFPSSGLAGSLARFAIVGNHLFSVSSTNAKIFDISDASNPVYKVDKPFGVGIETIFPIGNALFIGSMGGMYIYDITNPLSPKLESTYQHITSCDPVVANNEYAFVTLSTGETRCSRGINQLEIIDIKNKMQPMLVKVYPMVKPQGLTLNGKDLFVCDDKVKWFDVSNPINIIQKGIININAHDAIAINKTLMLIGDHGLSQYDYSGAQPVLLSTIKTGSAK